MTTRRETLLMAAAAAMPAAPVRAAPAPVAPYKAACVQMRVLHTHRPGGAFIPEALEKNLARMIAMIGRGANEVDARLYVFSEFCLQLQDGPLRASDWVTGAISIPGPETDRIAAAAQAARAYVAFNAVETIAAFPGRYFLSGVIVGPTGEIVLNYRKLYDLSNKTRPTDMLKAWLDRFGPRSLFPTVDTPIGVLATTVGADLIWPEMGRSLVFNGAEVICNLLASPMKAPSVPERKPGAPDADDPMVSVMMRRVRAYENMAYVATCNLGPSGRDETAPPQAMQPTEIVDYRGHLMAASQDASEGFITATLDIEALRAARTAPGSLNPLAQLQASVHAPGYDAATFARINRFTKTPIDTGREHDALQREDIADLVRRGVLKAPAKSN